MGTNSRGIDVSCDAMRCGCFEEDTSQEVAEMHGWFFGTVSKTDASSIIGVTVDFPEGIEGARDYVLCPDHAQFSKKGIVRLAKTKIWPKPWSYFRTK